MGKLLCNFLIEDKLYDFVNFLQDKYSVLDNKIFIFNVLSLDKFIVTYNLDLDNTVSTPDESFIINRKKESNTLYTINALNELIKILNDGYLDNQFPIHWPNYKNQLLIITNYKLTHHEIKLNKIINY